MIFYFSMQKGNDSTQMSNHFLISIIGEKNNQYLNERYGNLISILVRKFGHLSEFSLLGFLLAFSFTFSFDYSKKTKMSLSIYFGFLVAISDEWIQLFVIGRTSSVFDILIDGTGVILGVLLAYLFLRLKIIHKWIIN